MAAATTLTFSEIPTLSLAAASDPATKPAFLTDLRAALLNVGFFYLVDTGVPASLTADVVAQTRAFFETLTDEQKQAIEMKQLASFLGYSRLDNELTAGAPDHREQLDLATPGDEPPRPDEPPWANLRGPNQWPDAAALPAFRAPMEAYMAALGALSESFMRLVAEALDMPPDAFAPFFDPRQTHKMKLLRYPDAGAGGGQGVGAHKDSMLASFLLQASAHAGLQAQNVAGEWVDCPPVDGSLVVALGQGLEALTDGVCQSTTHRVLSPPAGAGPRYSVPFFQGVSFDAQFEGMRVPEHVRRLKQDSVARAGGGRRDDVEFTFVKGRWRSLGEATLMNRIKSHQDVGERWYPELLAQLRQDGVAAPSPSSSSAAAPSPADANPRQTVQAH